MQMIIRIAAALTALYAVGTKDWVLCAWSVLAWEVAGGFKGLLVILGSGLGKDK